MDILPRHHRPPGDGVGDVWQDNGKRLLRLSLTINYLEREAATITSLFIGKMTKGSSVTLNQVAFTTSDSGGNLFKHMDRKNPC